jgi:malate dehydrogenase
VTTSAPRPAGANQRGGRLEWLEENLALAAEIGAWLRSMESRPVVVVTNPVDVVTYELYRQSEWASHCFLGYSLSETARMAHMLARNYDVPYKEVSCPVLGEHGEGLVPVFSRATVGGESIDLDEAEREGLLDSVRKAPYTVMGLRGANESSRWVTGRGVALVVRCLQAGGTTALVGLSTPLESVYGYENVALSVPVRLGARGVNEIVEWDLSPWEQGRLDDAARAVAANIPE